MRCTPNKDIRMLYALVLLVAVAGRTDAYVIDHDLTFSDCIAASVSVNRAERTRISSAAAVRYTVCEPQKPARAH